ncbi:hypothetical protein [Paraburkholderia bannensis]|uniref:hypothetical protein n=1 Tax=Paraburkholderia bannensis TaxID=765414 RepID=UPI002AB75CD8|nr:hypothetical protein [Paraburkholderia bannensis]
MNRPILFDARQSREVLKAIRYGMEFQVSRAEGHDDADWLQHRLQRLRKHYLARRAHVDEKRSAFGNVIFYQLLKEKYAEFDYHIDKSGAPLSNLYHFKIDGHLPSLLTMLINDDVRHLGELERRYGVSDRLRELAHPVERLFAEATLVYPDAAAFHRFVDTVLHVRDSGQTLQLVSAICPDYSHTTEGGNVRYTFSSIGVQPGLAGRKVLDILPVMMRFLDALGVSYAVNLYGGDFESLAYDDADSPLGVTRPQFVQCVREQIGNIAQRLNVPVRRAFFFDEVGTQDAWIARHRRIYEALAAGDLGSTGLDQAALDGIFATRLPLYREWFKGVDEQALRQVFLKQAAEYALMGEIYAQRFDHFVVLGVDHHRMAPFYGFARPAAVIYRQTDYIVEDAAASAPASVGTGHEEARELEQECAR